MTMKSTSTYVSEFIVYNCPYCQYKHYSDVADRIDEGRNFDGKHTKCEKCGKEFWLEEY